MANFATQGALALLLCFGAARADATTFSVVYTFRSSGDAVHPSTLSFSDGTFYGTSFNGGTNGVGTVFGVTLAGAETLLDSLSPGTGYLPDGGVMAFKGALYGLGAGAGSSAKCGSVFRINSHGLHKLYAFKGGTDGCNPTGSLVEIGGRFYGVTQYGGSGASGTVFAVTPKGIESVVHSFGPGGGQYPVVGSLVRFGRTLFGVTFSPKGASGTVYQVTTSGVEGVIANDIGAAATGVVKIGGNLYGLSQENTFGTVYRVAADGTVAVIHEFRGTYGFIPTDLINVGGVLYGTTAEGGAYGQGMVFQVRQAGKFTTLYSFQGGTDGSSPVALVNVNGTVYGLTGDGGTGGNGTIFKIVP